jgi:acetyltransferase
MAADAISEYGLELSPMSQNTIKNLNDILPPHWSRGNPIDILGDATSERYVKVIRCCLEDKNIDGMLVIVNPQAMTNPSEIARRIGEGLRQRPYPVFAAFMGAGEVEEGRSIMNNENIPTYDTPERAVRSFSFLIDYARNLATLQEIPSRISPAGKMDRDKAGLMIAKALDGEKVSLPEVEAKELLACYGIPVNRTRKAASPDEALRVAYEIGYPVVMKILSPDILHKTEAGGVMTDLKSGEEVRDAFTTLTERALIYKPEAEILGVTLQQMVQRPDVELLLGASRDHNFGPVILFGLGGIYAELLADTQMGLPPLNQTLAHRLMEGTKAYRILKGYRNKQPADMVLFERMIVNLSHLLVDYPEIVELDMNPVLVKDGTPIAVDARIILEKTATRSPRHLVVSPYPEQFEFQDVASDGMPVFIRPVKPEDAPLLLELFDNLSSKSRYFRFFSHSDTLSKNLLVLLTQIDYDRHIALVALVSTDGEGEKMIGVARVNSDADIRDGEFAIVVGDQWQEKGIGKLLLVKILQVAREYGIKLIYGAVLGENKPMLGLARDLGFTVEAGQGSEYRVSIKL